jgi:hypothetical protein
VSVDSGLSGPVEGPVASAAPRAGTSPRVAPSRATRPGVARADALADAVSTPSFRTGRGRPRRRGRRVTRIVRRIELWSVLKIALVFNTIMLGIALGSVALLWGLANTTGLVDDLEGFLRDAGFEDFRFQGERMFEQVAFIGAVGALATTVFMVLATALLNLISEITGGIRFVVIEEIVEAPAPPSRPPAPLALPTVPPSAPPVMAPLPPAPAPPEPGRPDLGKPAPATETSATTEAIDAIDADEVPAARAARPAKKAAPRKAAPRKTAAKKAAPRSSGTGRSTNGPRRRPGRSGDAPTGTAGGSDGAPGDADDASS